VAWFLRYWLPLLLYLAATFVLSGMSSPPVPFNLDSNSLHYPEYALFSFLLLRAIHAAKPGMPSAWAVGSSLLLSGLWGLSDEIHQAFVPGRVPDVNDLIHDLVGAAAGIAAFFSFKYISLKHKRRMER